MHYLNCYDHHQITGNMESATSLPGLTTLFNYFGELSIVLGLYSLCQLSSQVRIKIPVTFCFLPHRFACLLRLFSVVCYEIIFAHRFKRFWSIFKFWWSPQLFGDKRLLPLECFIKILSSGKYIFLEICVV